MTSPESERSAPAAGTPGQRALLAAVSAALAAGRRAGLLPYVAALLSVQGTAYVAQLIIAQRMGPAEFAIVRTVEAVLSLLLIAASMGAPLLAVTATAALRSEAEQGRMLGQLLMLALSGSVVTALSLTLLAGVFESPIPGYLRSLCWVLCLTACGRTLLNYFQGRKEIRRLARYSVALSLLSLLIVVSAVWLGGLRGWVIGRYASEAVVVAVLLLAVGPALRFTGPVPGGAPLRVLVGAGGGIAVSLLVRAAADNAGLFVLSFSDATHETVGKFGLTNLVLLGLLVLPTSLGSLALPRIVERLAVPASARHLVRRVTAWSVLLSVGLAAVTALAAAPVANALLPSYRDAVPYLWIMLLVVPLRALSALSGIVLVATGRIAATVVANVLGLATTVAAALVLVPRMQAAGAAWAVCAGELVSILFYVPFARASLAALEKTS